MKKVRYALVGFGGIAENRIAKEGFACDRARFRPLPHAELVGAFDLNPARAAAAAALGLKWYASLDEILADAAVDAVFIATNNASHAQLAIAALKAGKHVIVEKPMATALADARKMARLARAKNLALAVDHMMVYSPWHLAARAALAKGRLGPVNDCCFHMEFAFGFTPSEAASWRCSKVEEMGGPIGDVASHCFYVAESLLRTRICAVAAVYYPKSMAIKAEDGALIRLRFADGTVGSVRAAFCEPRGGVAGTLTNLGFEVYGEKAVMRGYGTMFQLSGHPGEPIVPRVEIDDGRTVAPVRPPAIRNIYSAVIEAHAANVRAAGAKDQASADEAIRNLRLCAAAHRSARQGGAWIAIR